MSPATGMLALALMMFPHGHQAKLPGHGHKVHGHIAAHKDHRIHAHKAKPCNAPPIVESIPLALAPNPPLRMAPIVALRGFRGGLLDESRGQLTSVDDPSFWTAVPYGPLSAHVQVPLDEITLAEMQLNEDLGFVQLLLDQKPIINKRFLVGRSEIADESSPAVSLIYDFSIPCPQPGKHVLQARYVYGGLWSRLSAPLRFDVQPPGRPGIISVYDAGGVAAPLRKIGVIAISKNQLNLKLANVLPGDQVSTYIDGTRVNGTAIVDDSCCVSIPIAGYVPPGKYGLAVRIVPPGNPCGLSSEPSNEVMIHVFPEEAYLLRPPRRHVHFSNFSDETLPWPGHPESERPVEPAAMDRPEGVPTAEPELPAEKVETPEPTPSPPPAPAQEGDADNAAPRDTEQQATRNQRKGRLYGLASLDDTNEAAQAGAIEGAKAGAIEGAKAGAIEGAKAGAIAGAVAGAKAGAVEGAKAGKTAGKEAAKAGAEEGAKAGATEGAKAGAEEGAKAGAVEGAKAGATEGAKAGAAEGAKAGAAEGSKASAAEGAKAGATEGAKAGAEEGAKAGAVEGAKAGATEGAKAGAAEGAKAGAAEGSKASAAEGAKAGATEGAKAGATEGAKAAAAILAPHLKQLATPADLTPEAAAYCAARNAASAEAHAEAAKTAAREVARYAKTADDAAAASKRDAESVVRAAKEFKTALANRANAMAREAEQYAADATHSAAMARGNSRIANGEQDAAMKSSQRAGIAASTAKDRAEAGDTKAVGTALAASSDAANVSASALPTVEQLAAGAHTHADDALSAARACKTLLDAVKHLRSLDLEQRLVNLKMTPGPRETVQEARNLAALSEAKAEKKREIARAQKTLLDYQEIEPWRLRQADALAYHDRIKEKLELQTEIAELQVQNAEANALHCVEQVEMADRIARARAVTGPPSPFYFASSAAFPRREFGPNGEVVESDGVVIYEDMKFSFDADGNYSLFFKAGTPGMPATLRLRLLIQPQQGGPWHTITVPPIEFRPEADEKRSLDYQAKVQDYHHKGHSEILRRYYGQIGQGARIRREGTATFGFGFRLMD